MITGKGMIGWPDLGENAYEIMMKSITITENRPSLDTILTEAVADIEIEKLIMKGTREIKYKGYKLRYAEKTHGDGYTLREIGLHIGQSGNSIWKLLHKQ